MARGKGKTTSEQNEAVQQVSNTREEAKIPRHSLDEATINRLVDRAAQALFQKYGYLDSIRDYDRLHIVRLIISTQYKIPMETIEKNWPNFNIHTILDTFKNKVKDKIKDSSIIFIDITINSLYLDMILADTIYEMHYQNMLPQGQ